MGSTEAMEDYEFIDKGELEEASPPKPAEMASSAASSASIFHDRLTHLQNINTEEDDDDTDVEVSSPLASGETRDEHGLQVGLSFSESFIGEQCQLTGHKRPQIRLGDTRGACNRSFCINLGLKSVKVPKLSRASFLGALFCIFQSDLAVHEDNSLSK